MNSWCAHRPPFCFQSSLFHKSQFCPSSCSGHPWLLSYFHAPYLIYQQILLDAPFKIFVFPASSFVRVNWGPWLELDQLLTSKQSKPCHQHVPWEKRDRDFYLCFFQYHENPSTPWRSLSPETFISIWPCICLSIPSWQCLPNPKAFPLCLLERLVTCQLSVLCLPPVL